MRRRGAVIRVVLVVLVALVTATVLLLSEAAAFAAKKKSVKRRRRPTTTQVVPATPAPPPAPAAGPTMSAAEAEMARQILDRENAERAARGLAPLALDPAMSTLAVSWSRTISYNSLVHRDLGALFKDPAIAGRFEGLGENLFGGQGAGLDVSSAHNGWMNSAGHRANLLNPGFTTAGVGVYCGPNNTIVAVVEFGRAKGTSAPAIASGTPELNPIAAGQPGGARCG